MRFDSVPSPLEGTNLRSVPVGRRPEEREQIVEGVLFIVRAPPGGWSTLTLSPQGRGDKNHNPPSPMLLEIDNLIKTYQSGSAKVRAVDGVTLHVDAGEFVAVQGPSGCGKTTL